MKSFFWRFTLCIVPVVVACWVTYDAWVNDKFKKGVDLSGGTILVYEMDLRKLEEKRKEQGDKGEVESSAAYFKSKASELAAALKRRIDPTATYNIVIRPAGSEGRVEIILPTGGQEKAREAEEDWQKLLKDLKSDFKNVDLSDLNVPRGSVEELIDQIQQKSARKIWETKLLNDKEAWNRLLDKLKFDPDKGTGFAALDQPDPEAKEKGKTYMEELKELKPGNIDSMITILARAENEPNKERISNDIRQYAWNELAYRITHWDELRNALAKEVKEKDSKKKEEIVQQQLDQLEEELKNVPADSFDELIGRVQQMGNVVNQAAVDAFTDLIGPMPDAGVMPRKKIEDFVSENYGPSPSLIEAKIKKSLPEQDLDLVKDPTLEDVQRIKDLVSKVGALEFKILANEKDDATAIKEISQLINSKDPAVQKALEEAAVNGLPPPVVTVPGKANELKKYDIQMSKGNKSTVTYSWVELGKQERKLLGFNNDARTDAKVRRKKIWLFMQANNNKAVQVPDPQSAREKDLWQGALFYRRECKDRNLPEKERREKKYEYFVLARNPEFNPQTGKQTPAITGKYLRSASAQTTEGRPAVSFMFDATGGELFGTLTGKNVPDESGTEESRFKRHLAIILDGLVMSAPTVNSKITTRGQITGHFTRKEVDSLVNILRSGALPATLKPQPVSESTIGSLLGEDTVNAGLTAVLWAFIGVLAFMVIYYRFSGIVACVALFANLVLTVGFMVAVQATFTLPGLAGLVLMLGMAVDANVLIYERLREERDRGASLPLALRNGYERAFPTIIDTHLSSIFTAIVLYAVGTDQLKGFAISLAVGLIISLFTSLYMTRTMFDFWLSRGWLPKLGMFRLLSKPNLNFMGARKVVFTVSMVVAFCGLGLFLARGDASLNIDFKGGTAFSGRMTAPKSLKQLRDILDEKSQEKMLQVESVEEIEKSEGREFKLVYKEPDGKSSEPYEVVLANRPEGNTKAAREEDVKKRAGGLPDWSLEQMFVSEYIVTDGTDESRFFTVRTSEKERPLVQVMIDRLFRVEKDGNWVSMLKKIELDDIDESMLESKSTVKLKFSEEASPSFVRTLIHRQLRRQFGIDDATGQLKVVPEIAGVGASKEGRFKEMLVTFNPDLKTSQVPKVEQALADMRQAFDRPQPERLENFDSELAADNQMRALVAIFVSWLAVVMYLWFRFGSWSFGLAAVICLVHDLCFALGILAVSAYIQPTLFGQALKIEDFKLDLTGVAALLTLVGYSVADTIVVFDRIREVRGKNPDLTPKMVNDSVNQCLSRTLLTSGTTFVVVAVLYWFGGPGIHMFAFIMVVGVLIGTYSSIYIASPLLLFLGEGQHAEPRQRRTETAGATA